MSFILIYAGHFLFRGDKSISDKNDMQQKSTSEGTQSAPVTYRHITENINGARQEINILETDAENPEVKILPVLSFDLIYGYEELSSMVSRKKAYAAVNAGFFYEYGLPSGMVVTDGKLVSASSGRHPVFMINEGKASLIEMSTGLWLESGKTRLKANKINAPASKGDIVIFTPFFGSSNRVDSKNLTITIIDDKIVTIGEYTGEVKIPANGMLATFILPGSYTMGKLPFKKGDALKLVHEPSISAGSQMYECGSWIIKDGKIVIGEKDEWVGVLTNRDPRTAIGIKDNGNVVLFTVDGRQPDYSEGMTGRELGEYMLGMGVKQAAMLDGGASTEMIVNGKVVNRPSFKGQERPLGGGILVCQGDGYVKQGQTGDGSLF